MQGTIFPPPLPAWGLWGRRGQGGLALGVPGGDQSGEEDTRVETGTFWAGDIYSILPHGYPNPEGAFWGLSRAFLLPRLPFAATGLLQ